ncbi:Uncharacterized protein TPAR_00631 [Tolypocladium paradoxum]|uniref:Uncharacterized protein n=1 Tax=Tolypocladium paradoxum TaxID=94208 RepID=A0A2S4L9R7_9HYPO|nr:Uncharacterized protein TPAR_00631 [Tolypocladium paradoxum]
MAAVLVESDSSEDLFYQRGIIKLSSESWWDLSLLTTSLTLLSPEVSRRQLRYGNALFIAVPANTHLRYDLVQASGLHPSPIMCDWEEFLFICNHSVFRLKSYCHFARNDPYHQCFGVKVLRNSWQQGVLCEKCAAECQGAGVKDGGSSQQQGILSGSRQQ